MLNSLIVSENDTKNLTVISRQNVLEKDFTVYGSVENPLFLAKDVAEWIDYAKTSEGFYNVSMMLKSIDDDEKLTINIVDSENKAHNQSFVTENGLYEILMLSRKPIAKQFKKEVKKILHQIRLTGGYTVPRTFADALRLAAEQQERIALMQPKAECYDELIDATGLFNLQTTSKMLGVNFNWFKNCLIDNEYLYRGSHDTLLPYANRKNIFVVKEWTKNGIAGFQTLVTPKGTDILRTLFKVWGKDKDDSKKILEETTESFIEKGEKEYQKIMDETAGNYLERAIENCPDCNHTILDLSESFSIEQVAKIIEEPEVTVLNFIAAKGWIDPETKKPLLPLKYIDSNGRITVDGKDKIVSAFFTIKKTEKGMKAFSCGKGE